MKQCGRPGGEEGFSLIELLMVVAVIGILVSIAVVSYAVSVSTSNKTACKANLRVIEEQVLLYSSDTGEYPPTLGDLYPRYVNTEKCLHCPESGLLYDYDPTTGEVSCTHHGEG